MRACTGRHAATVLIPLLLSLETVRAVSPVVFEPSQYWEGNDGPWSTFSVRLGNPEQVVRVLPSTQGYNTVAVIPLGCNTTNDYTACVTARGGVFDPAGSKTWQDEGWFGSGMQANLGYSDVNADFGLDGVGLGIRANPNLTFANQVIGGIYQDDFYIGTFGLGTQPSNFTANLSEPKTSFFTTLWEKSAIPSYTWSYTAGAQYQFTGVLGSVIFGGYDSSRISSTGLSFPMSSDVSRDLVVGLQSITATYAAGSKLLMPSGGIYTFIDSTLPYIWLPLAACEAFEQAFGLEWNSTLELYLVNETLHDKLSSMNPTFNFKLGVSTAGGSTVDISLPYASFDLTLTAPLVPNNTRYFPIKRANETTQYTLGRAFLQESMLIADYERGSFSVAPCTWVSGAKASIVTIQSVADAAKSATSASATATSGAGKSTTTKFGISTGAIAGIAIAGTLAVVLGIVLFVLRKKKKWPFGKNNAVELDSSAPASEVGRNRDNPDEPSAYSAIEMKGNTVETVSVPLAEMPDVQDMHPVEGYYSSQKHDRHEMADTTPARSELASSDHYVHEMFDPSVYHEMHSTTSSQARRSPTSRSVPSVAQPFSWAQTPQSAVSDTLLPRYELELNSPGVSHGTVDSGYRTRDDFGAVSEADEYPQDQKQNHRSF